MHDLEEMRRKLLAALEERGLLMPGRAEAADGTPLTIYGQPAWRTVSAGHEAQALMAGTTRQRDLVASAYATPATGANLCAAWVERAFERLGLGAVTGDAAELYAAWCRHTDTRQLKVGMIIAVSTHNLTSAGRIYGHVGIYIGDDKVMHNVGPIATYGLDQWINTYGTTVTPRWGWALGKDLSQMS